MKLVFASQNPHKIEEVRSLLKGIAEVQGLDAFPIQEELPETGTKLEENALQKAEFVAGNFNVNCFADDTGLEVEALGGAPGVYSARYAGEGKNPEDNMNKLLLEMQGKENRKARFRTVIALVLDGEKFLFEGTMNGSIISAKRGSFGFGYDPVFLPEGSELTFAEMKAEDKNAISHRAKAVAELVRFLQQKLN